MFSTYCMYSQFVERPDRRPGDVPITCCFVLVVVLCISICRAADVQVPYLHIDISCLTSYSWRPADVQGCLLVGRASHVPRPYAGRPVVSADYSRISADQTAAVYRHFKGSNMKLYLQQMSSSVAIIKSLLFL